MYWKVHQTITFWRDKEDDQKGRTRHAVCMLLCMGFERHGSFMEGWFAIFIVAFTRTP